MLRRKKDEVAKELPEKTIIVRTIELEGSQRDLYETQARRFEKFQATTFPELAEPPSYFLKEVKEDKQMNFRELAGYEEYRQRVRYRLVPFVW